VCVHLAGYLIGGLVIAPLSDRFGRRNALLIALAFTVAGSRTRPDAR
jgi:MFS family permease